MRTEYFQGVVGEEADDVAAAGRGKSQARRDARGQPPVVWAGCRDARRRPAGEHELLQHLVSHLAAPGDRIAALLTVEFYVSLKSNPFVVLTGAEGAGKLAYVQRFAEALLGAGSPQYAHIPGDASWLDGTGQHRYYQSLQERFTSWRFLDVLQDAAAPGNVGKPYIACLSHLHPGELDYYFTSLLRIGADGRKRLNLPGYPDDQLPSVPSNLWIVATLDVAARGQELNRAALRHAGLIEFHGGPPPRPAPPLPVGFQRMWLNAGLRSISEARERLHAILGPDALGRLRPSPEISRLLWDAGVALRGEALQDVTNYVANSFDADGRGLFDPYDARRNAQIAYDSQVLQRVLWRLHDTRNDDLRHDLLASRRLAAGAGLARAVA